MYYEDIEEIARYICENIGNNGMEVYFARYYDGDYDIGIRQQGSYGEIDNSIIFIKRPLDDYVYQNLVSVYFGDKEIDENTENFELMVEEVKNNLYKELSWCKSIYKEIDLYSNLIGKTIKDLTAEELKYLNESIIGYYGEYGEITVDFENGLSVAAFKEYTEEEDIITFDENSRLYDSRYGILD